MLSFFAVGVIYAAPREYSTDELITEPRPGEEFVNIQTTSKDKVDLQDKSFSTSHKIPQLSKVNRSQDFQTAHKIPLKVPRTSRSVNESSDLDARKPREIDTETRVSISVVESSTKDPVQRVVTQTSIKTSKSKKIHKSVVKNPHDGIIDIKADEGLIDERPNADEEERNIMKKKFLKTEVVKSTSEEFVLPLRLNVPLEDEVKEISYDKKRAFLPNFVLTTTQEPPITTFNYKHLHEKTMKSKNLIPQILTNEFRTNDKSNFETLNGGEAIKTAESKTITVKKDIKHEKKEKYKKDENNQKDESDFYIVPVNKQSTQKDVNFDFVDADEKVLVPAGSSPSQSSRINVKKGPNGQEYEYEYVYYYYDEEDEGGNGGNAGASKDGGKTVISSTEKVYNGHDGPPKDVQEQNYVHRSSTSGSKYLPTEATKTFKNNKKTRVEETEVNRNENSSQGVVGKNGRNGSGSRFSPSQQKKQSEPANNEVLPPAGRSGFRPRGRSTTTTTTEEIPSIGEERLPSNTRFPPRSRTNGASGTSPQPQEAVAKSKVREGSNQSRLRIPNSSLLDSSSFRTHASDASIEDDSSYESELQKRGQGRGQVSEQVSRRGGRPVPVAPFDNSETEVSKRPSIRRPSEDRKTKENVEYEDVTQEKRVRTNSEDGTRGRRIKVNDEESDQGQHYKVPTEENDHGRQVKVNVPLEDDEVYPKETPDSKYQDRNSNANSESNPRDVNQSNVNFDETNLGAEKINQEGRLNVDETYQETPPKVTYNDYETSKVPLEEKLEPLGEKAEISDSQIPIRDETVPQQQFNRNGNEDIVGNTDLGAKSFPEDGTLEKTQSGQVALEQSENLEGKEFKTVDSTTEDQNAVGLTSAMMEKVALDLYAILQQAQNENIRTNFVDGNSTDIVTDGLNENPTEYSTFGDGSTAEILVQTTPITTTTTTTTTTTPAPTTTTTTTTTPEPTQAAGRGRYRNRVSNGAKGRTKVSTTTTEAPEEVTSPKTRGRFHGNHGARGTGSTFSRKPNKAVAKEAVQEISDSEETSKSPPEKSFGDRPRNRFRASPKVNTSNAPAPSASPASASAVSATGAQAGGTRVHANDRFHSRRRGGVRGSTAVSQPPPSEETPAEEKEVTHAEDPAPVEEKKTPAVSALKPIRPKIGGVRPLRPGLRAPSVLQQRGQANVPPTAPQSSVETEEEKVVAEPELQGVQQSEEASLRQTPETPAAPSGDALTRLKSRPRLRIGANPNLPKPQGGAVPPPGNRRKLVSSLLPKRKPNEEKVEEKTEEDTEEKVSEEVPVEEEQQSPVIEESSSTTAEPEPKGLSGLLSGRRRNLNRRPGTLYSRAQAQPAES